MNNETVLSNVLNMFAVIGVCVLFVFGVLVLAFFLNEQYLTMDCIRSGGIWLAEYGKGCIR